MSRVLVTDADEFPGPAVVERFRRHGAEVVARADPLAGPGDVDSLVTRGRRGRVACFARGVVPVRRGDPRRRRLEPRLTRRGRHAP